MSGTVLRETRVIWRKLDCLNPNLQKVEVHIRRKDTRNRRRSGRLRGKTINLRDQERCPMRVLKEMSGTPKSR